MIDSNPDLAIYRKLNSIQSCSNILPPYDKSDVTKSIKILNEKYKPTFSQKKGGSEKTKGGNITVLFII